MCQAFQITAAERADGVALRTPGGGTEITFGELAERVAWPPAWRVSASGAVTPSRSCSSTGRHPGDAKTHRHPVRPSRISPLSEILRGLGAPSTSKIADDNRGGEGNARLPTYDACRGSSRSVTVRPTLTGTSAPSRISLMPPNRWPGRRRGRVRRRLRGHTTRRPVRLGRSGSVWADVHPGASSLLCVSSRAW